MVKRKLTREDLRVIAQAITEISTRKFDPHQLRDPHTGEWTDSPGGAPSAPDESTEFQRNVSKGDWVEATKASEFNNGKWVPASAPVRGRVIKANAKNVMIQKGRGRYFTASRRALKEVVSNPSAPEKLRADLGQDTSTFSLEQRKAMGAYVTEGVAEQLNRSLRHGTSGQRNAKVKEGLDGAFKRARPLRSEGIVYRGAKVRGIRQLKPGTVLDDAGFMSTSAARGRAAGFARDRGGDLFEIELPPGTKALDMNRATGGPEKYGAEREILLPRGTRLVIESIEEPKHRRPGRNEPVGSGPRNDKPRDFFRVIHARVLHD